MSREPIVDVHAHVLEPVALDEAGPHGVASGFGARPHRPPPGTHFALEELDRASGELGLRIVQLPAQIDGVYLGEPPLRSLWEGIDRRGLVVFIHPDGVRDAWFQRYGLWNSVGQPIEEARVLASLIYDYCDTCVYEPSTLAALRGARRPGPARRARG